MVGKNKLWATRHCSFSSAPLPISLLKLFLSHGNTPDSLLTRSPDHSCTFLHPPYTFSLHTHTISHTRTHTLPTSSLLPSMCHWLLLSYKPPPSLFFFLPSRMWPIKALPSPALWQTLLCSSTFCFVLFFCTPLFIALLLTLLFTCLFF